MEMVVPALDMGGMETMVANLTLGLARRGHEVGVTCLESAGPIAEQLSAQQIRVSVVRTPGLSTIVRAKALDLWFRGLDPDVVHVHSGAWLKGARAARRAGVPRIVHTMHGLLEQAPWYTTWLDRWAARSTDRNVAVSTTLQEHLIDTVGVAPSQCTVITNGVDTDRFHPGPRRPGWRVRNGLPERAHIIGTIARLDEIKNQALLLDAFARLRAQGPDVMLAIAGDGPLRANLEGQVARLGLTGAVWFLGETREPAVVHREFDLFVLSSLAEGTSISILEAMASGVCVVATAVGGTPALLGGGRLGCLVPSGDAGALVTAMGSLLRDSRERHRLASAARQAAVNMYGIDAMVQHYEREYGCGGTAVVRAVPAQKARS